jgi:hypothetical protein
MLRSKPSVESEECLKIQQAYLTDNTLHPHCKLFWSILFGEIISAYSEPPTKHINALDLKNSVIPRWSGWHI